MTKKLLLAAAAMGALAFAGAANAGNITAGQISGVSIFDAALTPYTIASEVVLGASGTSSVAATSSITQNLSSPLALTNGAQADLIVTYTLTGPAEFGAVAVANLAATGSANAGAPTTGIVAISADKKSATFYVTYTAAAAGNIAGFTLSNLNLKVTGTQDVSIASETRLTAGGVATTIDTMTAKKIVAFKTVLGGFDNEARTVTAALPSFLTFRGNDSTSNALGYSVEEGIRGSLAGGDELEIGDVFDGAAAVVKGPQVEALAVTLGGVDADEETLTAMSGDYTLTAAQLGTAQLALNADGETEIEAGSYSVAVTPEFAEGFAGNAASTLTVLTVALDGTNFVAPWFALANPSANSTLRLANNGSADTGPVIISLKANNGAAAPTGTFTLANGIPAGGFVSVNGAQLQAAFGTTATNGDLQVTIQSDVTNVSAKVRTQQATGQIFENSLGQLGAQ